MATLEVDFAKLSDEERIRHFEIEGFVVFPDILSAPEVTALKGELEDLPMRPSFYSDKPTFAAVQPQWHSPKVAGLIGQHRAVSFLNSLLGDEVVFTHGHYIVSHPGQPALELHADYAPYGSTYSRWEESCPLRVRFLYYLDDTSIDRGALRIIPRSHICMHSDALPYRRYKSHTEELLVPMKAGSALCFAVRMFHGTGPNTSTGTRGMLEIDYRPLWARPLMPVAEWPDDDVRRAPERSQPFLHSPNSFDRPWEFLGNNDVLDRDAPGMAPSRWGDGGWSNRLRGTT